MNLNFDPSAPLATIDLYDAHTRKMVWRGVATDTVSDKTSTNTQHVDTAIHRMFAKYPPAE